MKVQCIVGKSRENRDVCFSYQHMYLPLKKYVDCYDNFLLHPETTHMIFLDVIQNVRKMKSHVLYAKSQGVKIIAVTFDPANFEEADLCIKEGLIDLLVLTDKQFENRFDFNVYISDYYLNKDLFPKIDTKKDSGVCYFGHLIAHYGRTNEYRLPVIEDFSSFPSLYKSVQEYNGCFVYDTGRGEDPTEVIHHNKAKAIEALMCGVNAYCQDGIKTKNYDRFLKSYNQVKSPAPIEFTQEDIMEINEKVIKDFIDRCEQC